MSHRTNPSTRRLPRATVAALALGVLAAAAGAGNATPAAAGAGAPVATSPAGPFAAPAGAAPAAGLATPEEATPQDGSYLLYVAAESDDIVEKVRFDGDDLELVRSIPVGVWPTEIEGPHGLQVSPDGRYWFVSMAHGQPGPFGLLYKFDTESDTLLGEVELGMFPATMAYSPSIGLLYVVNFNLHGLPEPSDISVVDPETMSEVGRVDVGVMPHGARMNRQGTRLYSVNMMDDTLVEIDAYRMEVVRQLALSPHGEHKLSGDHPEGHDMGSMSSMDTMIKPTWATPVGDRVYVAGNGAAKILEVDLESWEITRTFDTSPGPYNLDVSPDGRILGVTYKSDKAVGFWDLGTGEELARIPTLRPIPHGIAISADGRYAFVSIEGIGGEPGSVEAYDLETFERVSNLDVAKQAGGIVLVPLTSTGR